MEPNSWLLVALLLIAAAAGIVAAVRIRVVVVQVLAGLLAIVLAAGSGIAIVNDYYAYYQTWSQLSTDLHGSYTTFASGPKAARGVQDIGRGRIEEVSLPGAHSGISRPALVYLPPQYFEPAYANTAFPVVELLHGSPGVPQNWVVQMRVGDVLDKLIADHRMGPVVAVIPTIAIGSHYEECVDAPRALDDTYLTQDVRADIVARFRVTRVPAEWGIAGYSTGGYCAANLALRHQALFGAAAIMDGYFRPTDGPAAAALHFDPAAERANDPLLAAQGLPAGTHPLPSFWVMAGSADLGDLAGARAFLRALHGLDAVTLHQEAGAGHNYAAWRAADPAMLTWLWTQLAPPSLRVQFPVSQPERIVSPQRRPVAPQRSKATTTARSSAAYRAARASTAASDAAARVHGKP